MSKQRLYHLGLDWGTSTTKLILRDYEQNNAFVIVPDGLLESYLYPSTIVIHEGRVFFGGKAEQRRKTAEKTFDALKGSIYDLVRNDGDILEDIQEKENLATLYLTHIIYTGMIFAEKHAERDRAEALMGMTLGVPAEELEQSSLKDLYYRMVRCAYKLAIDNGYDPQGRTLTEAMAELKTVSESIKQQLRGSGFISWLRPELAAAMYWGMQSPKIEEDLYTCIDIGAWTTNVSYFRIRSTGGYRTKDAISFYGGATGGPGVITLLKKISDDQGKHYTELIGREEQFLLPQRYESLIEAFQKECFKVHQRGFHAAYAKHPTQSAWDGQLSVMVVGGGSKIGSVKNFFCETCPYEGWQLGLPVPDLGVPSDLFNFPAQGIIPREPFSGDYTFLLVAYGLSVRSDLFPQTTLSPQVAPFEPQSRKKPFKDTFDLGYDDK